MHIPNIFKANKNNPRCGFHALQKKLIYKKIDLWLQFLGGLVCFHPNKSTLIFSSNWRHFFWAPNFIHQWIPKKFKCHDDDWPSSITISFGCSQFKSNLKDFSSCRKLCCIRFKSVGWSRNEQGKEKKWIILKEKLIIIGKCKILVVY